MNRKIYIELIYLSTGDRGYKELLNYKITGDDKMRRRVIQIAESTQLISLPRKWALRYGIKKGEELEVEEQGNKLLVSSGHDAGGKKTVLDVRGQPKLKRRSICAAYLKGYDEIEETPWELAFERGVEQANKEMFDEWSDEDEFE